MSAPEPREIELKLELDPADAEACGAALLSAFGAPGRSESLASVYFDTRKRDLHKHGLTLRIRRVGGRRVQTVKVGAGAGAGLFDRSEWEAEVPGDAPDLEAAAESPVPALLSKRKPLGPVFETVVDRTIWTVAEGEAVIEVALDQGRVVAGAASSSLSELELELKHGPPAALFAVIGRLERVPSLRPGVLAKSERGYALLAGKTPRAHKAEPTALAPGLSTAAAFQRVMHGCLRQLCLNAPLVVATREPDALHQARVGLRRLRSALSLFGDAVAGDRRLADLKTRLRTISAEFGDARNLDVFLAQSARPAAGHHPDGARAASVLDAVEARRDAAYGKVVATLRSAAFGGLVLDLVAWIEAGPWLRDDDPLCRAAREQPIEAFAAAVLDRRRRTLRRKGRHLDRLDRPARHRVRIHAKKLRYAAEFFAGLTRGRRDKARHAAFIAAMEDVQQALGDLNDIRTGHDLAEGLAVAEATAAPALVAAGHRAGEQEAGEADLVQKALKAHQAFAAAKPFWRRWGER